jgi:hypothetical protein
LPEAAHLQLVGITTLFGFIIKGTTVTPEEEQAHLADILAAEYPLFAGKPALQPPPLLLLGPENLQTYGASTLPTLVLVDRDGTVRNYHTGLWKLDSLQQALADLSTTVIG